MMPGVSIRGGRREDAETAGQVGVEARDRMFAVRRELLGEDIFAAAYGAVADTKAQQLAELVAAAPERCLVAEADGELIGFLCWSIWPNDRVGEILELTVRKDWQGRGVGTRLCREALELLRRRGCSSATVRTGGEDGHVAARGLYRKVGFGPALPWVQYFRRLEETGDV
jgi:ribosomal protein S18 acetylase RimI-like enzyme